MTGKQQPEGKCVKTSVCTWATIKEAQSQGYFGRNLTMVLRRCVSRSDVSGSAAGVHSKNSPGRWIVVL